MLRRPDIRVPQTASRAHLPWIYRQFARVRSLSYVQKVGLCVIGCAHLPAAVLLATAAAGAFEGLQLGTDDLMVALSITLASGLLSMWLLTQMLRPVEMAAHALESYAIHGRTSALPTLYEDAAGRLMHHASGLMADLDDLRSGPEIFDLGTELPNRLFLTRLMDELVAASVAFHVRTLRIAALSAPGRSHAVSDALRTLAEMLDQDAAARTIARIDDHTLALVEMAPEGASLPPDLRDLLADFTRGAAGPLAVHAGAAAWPRDGGDAEHLLAIAVATLAPLPLPLGAPHIATSPSHGVVDLEDDLRRAVTDGDFHLFLQPVVATRTERIVSAEALLRWNRPRLGHVPPARFIPLLEQAGMIEEVGRWVLTATCRAIKVCDAAGLPRLQIAVNISPQELRNPGLLRQITQVLDFEGVAPDRIEMELTESAASEDLTRSRALLVGLRDLGVGVAIDDFGTGRGGLAYLKVLPFSKLKIDREFVSGVDSRRDSQAICQSAIALAGGFDLDVVAEGVETAAEADRLRLFGCTQLQGYRFGRPMPAVDFPAFALHAT